MNHRPLSAAAAALALAALTVSPAHATDYGRPSGRWFEAIVTHEVGHCLGWYNHTTPYPSIMRSSLKPSYINSGAHAYKPSSNDYARMAASRSNSVAGENDTSYVQYPFVSDYVPVYNKTGRAAAFTAADRWDPNTALNVVPVSYEPAQGITIIWDSSRAGSTNGGWITHSWIWNGAFWQIKDCTVHVNTDVET